MPKAIDLSKSVSLIKSTDELTDLIGINPETGEFDIEFVPESIRQDVIDMGKSMAQSQKKKGCNRKPKKRIRIKKTYGKNKKRKKKK